MEDFGYFRLSKGYNVDDYRNFVRFNVSLRNRIYYCGYVYIVRLDNGTIKIGSTTTIDDRMKTLHREYAKYNINFVYVLISYPIENYIEIEKRLHKAFHKYRIPNTEEFSINMDISKFAADTFYTLCNVIQEHAIFATADSILTHIRDDMFADIALFSLLAHKIDYDLLNAKKDHKDAFPKDMRKDIVKCGYLDTINSRFLALCKDGQYRDTDGFITLVRKEDSYSIEELDKIRNEVILAARIVQESNK